MKNKIISIVITSICIFSCNEDFLQRDSLTQLSQGSFWTNADDAISGVNAIYNSYRSLTIYFMQQFGSLDEFSDIAYMPSNNTMYTGTYPNNGGWLYNPWQYLYGGIYRANTAIKRIPDIDMNDKLKKRLVGEAKFLRSLYYFKLCDLFGGVPIYDEPMNYDEAFKERSSVDEVYDFIINDLTEAIPMLDEYYTGKDIGRATSWAALALRGKTKLYAKRWGDAAADFKNVMDNSDRDLHPEYYKIFDHKWKTENGRANTEILFDVQFIRQTGYGCPCEGCFGNPNTNRQQQRSLPTPTLVNEYETTDGKPFSWSNYTNVEGQPFDPDNMNDWKDEATVRKIYENRDSRMNQTVIVPWSEFIGRGGQKFIFKYPQVATDPECYKNNFEGVYGWRKFVPDGTEEYLLDNSPNNFPVIRFADVLLMFAEAQNEANGPDQSVYDAINAVRKRVDMPSIPHGTKDEVRDRIRHERKVEFACEGIWHSDIRRWKIGVVLCNHTVKGFSGTPLRTRVFNEREHLWGIPSQEIVLNPKLTQNQGWE